MRIERVNPDGLFSLDVLSQIVVVESSPRLAFIAGQGAFDAAFQPVGAEDLHAQTIQAFRNLRTAVTSVGGTVDTIVSMTIYIVNIDPEKVETFSRAMSECLDGVSFPATASTMIGVQGLAEEHMLIEISAVAALSGSD